MPGAVTTARILMLVVPAHRGRGAAHGGRRPRRRCAVYAGTKKDTDRGVRVGPLPGVRVNRSVGVGRVASASLVGRVAADRRGASRGATPGPREASSTILSIAQTDPTHRPNRLQALFSEFT